MKSVSQDLLPHLGKIVIQECWVDPLLDAIYQQSKILNLDGWVMLCFLQTDDYGQDFAVVKEEFAMF